MTGDVSPYRQRIVFDIRDSPVLDYQVIQFNVFARYRPRIALANSAAVTHLPCVPQAPAA
jgi:hypothetical protein